MTDEQKLLAHYRASDDRGKSSILEHAASTAEDWPAESPSQLNNGVSDPVSLSGSELDDLVPTPVVRPPE